MSNLNFVGSPSFRAPPSPTNSTPRRSRRSSAASSINNPRLSVIREDSSPTPHGQQEEPPPGLRSPAKTHNRPFHRRFLGDPPRYSTEKTPPNYSFLDLSGPKAEKFDEIRNSRFIARRGGWKRICLIFLIVVLVIVGLVVGLVVGLTKRRHNNSSSSSSSSANNTGPSTSGPFPAGTWTFNTFLTNTSSACSSQSTSWVCPPGQTYTQSPSFSSSIFQWTINGTAGPSSTNFTISSLDNPFAVTFAPTELTLANEGTDNEHYVFSTSPIQKITFPGGNVKCYFNETTFTAHLYTRKSTTLSASSSPSSIPSPSSSTSAQPQYAPWNHAVDASQSISGGGDVPQCFEWNNGMLGNPVTEGYEAQAPSDVCSCTWTNYGDT